MSTQIMQSNDSSDVRRKSTNLLNDVGIDCLEAASNTAECYEGHESPTNENIEPENGKEQENQVIVIEKGIFI